MQRVKILLVCSGNSGNISPFVQEQADSISALSNEVLIYRIIGKGALGYLINLPRIKIAIKEYHPDIIHAHFGLSGLVSILQRTVPVVITFHGSDAYIFYVKILSKIAARLSAFNIFVSAKIKARIGGHFKSNVIPCGVDLNFFHLMNKNYAREKFGLDKKKNYILFSSSFDNTVKNYKLAKTAVDILNKDITLIELVNKSREEVNILLNACDLVLLTSFSEGSPQFIKEAIACNCPIVSTDVGDVSWLIDSVEGCYITSFDPEDVAKKINKALEFSENIGRTKGRGRLIELELDTETIAHKIINVYKKVLNNDG